MVENLRSGIKNRSQIKLRQAHRATNGSILVLICVTMCFLLVPLMMALTQFGLYHTYREHSQNVVEAAALVAANDLSKIVINDPHFGYVSLSNYPPTGKGTCALDGEPLPVAGINTMVGTLRQNTIIASELQNDNLAALVDTDKAWLDSTISQVNSMIANVAQGSKREVYYDVQGEKVDLVGDVKAFLIRSLPANVRVESVKITNGWLDSDCSSTVPIPQPERLAQLKPKDSIRGKYRAFSNFPACGRDFYFGGVGEASKLVSAREFHPADNKHINTIIKIECKLVPNDFFAPLAAFGIYADSTLSCVACCQPYSLPDNGPKGVMTLRFTSGSVPGLMSWSDLLARDNFADNQISNFNAINGDYPLDKEARLQPIALNRQTTTSQQFAEHFYTWLRNGQLRPRIDSVTNMMSEPFLAKPCEIYAYEFGRNGMISRRALTKDPFPIGVTADGQSMTIADTTMRNGLRPIIIFRNNAKQLGTVFGGKHGGQSLAGSPLNWCELSEYGGDEMMANNLGIGHQGTLLSVFAPGTAGQSNNNVVDASFNPFKSFYGENLQFRPRRSYYSGGLAVDIEVGGTRPSTAALDVERQRNLRYRFNRKV